ncbi:twin-arginine translocase subunit TatC, partial [Halolamina litorea]
MAEEPEDDGGREPSGSPPTGSDEERTESESDAEPELTDPEGPGPHDNDPESDGSTDGPDPSENGDAPDEDIDSDDIIDDDADQPPASTDVEGLGNDTDADDDASTTDVDGDEDDEGYMFEDYDPNAAPDGDIATTDPSANGASDDDDLSEGLLGSGPDSDQEMPLAAHIEEMMTRLAVVFAVGGAVALTLLGLGQLFEPVPTSVELIDILWNNAIPGAPEIAGRRPRLYSPLELILTELKVTALAGLLVALPVFVYETYLFMRPGLYPQERRYYLSAIPTSLI